VPLAIVIAGSPDRQMMFVQQHAAAPVSALMQSLEVDRKSAIRSAYARLSPASLEAMAERL
jgi:hypothetical protein